MICTRDREMFGLLLFAMLSLGFSGSALAAPSASVMVPSHAAAGARVILIGAALQDPQLTVEFTTGAGGSASAKVIAREESQIEVAVPTLAGNGPVRLQRAGITYATFSFTLDLAPTFSSVSTLSVATVGLKDPSDVAVSNRGEVFLADTMNHRIVILQPDGRASVLAGNGSPGFSDGFGANAQFNQPSAVEFDELTRTVYVADTGNHRIRAISQAGQASTIAGTGRPGDKDGIGTDAGLKFPRGLALGATGIIWIADSGNHKIKKFTPGGAVVTVAGQGSPGFKDGPGLEASFQNPAGLSVSQSGAVLVSDSGNHRVRILENGVVATIAGTGRPGFADGSGTASSFHEPEGLAADDGGAVFCGDSLNNAIRRISFDQSRTVTTVAGRAAGYSDGPTTGARFHQPLGMVAKGALFVADSKNDAIRMVTASPGPTVIYPATGPVSGGNTVRLFGFGFIPGRTDVLFGPSPARSVSFVAESELLVVVPPGISGPTAVSVRTPGGQGVLPAGYSYSQPPTIAIRSPEPGARVSATSILVRGQATAMTRDVGVVVNGVVADVDIEHQGTSTDPYQWIAQLPVEAGPVTLTARVTTAGGESAMASRSFEVQAPPFRVELRPRAKFGTVPFEAAFSVRVDGDASILKYELDLNGDGVYETTSVTNPDEVFHRYETAGVYVASIRITTASGSVVIAHAAVVAQSLKSINRVIKGVWFRFVERMAEGDIEGVLSEFAGETTKEKYRRHLVLIRPSIKEFANSIRTIRAVRIGDGVAHYLLTRMEGGQPAGYHVYFSQDENGTWKIVQF